MTQEIVLTSDGSQTFNVVLDGVNYLFEVKFNTRMEYWTANISSEGIEIVNGIGLLGGVDIVQQLTDALKNLFIVNIDESKIDATDENLGTSVKLFKRQT